MKLNKQSRDYNGVGIMEWKVYGKLAKSDGIPTAVKVVIARIDAIGEVTLDSKDAIEAARAAYDNLTEEQKTLVTNYETLTKAEETYAALADAAAVKEVEDLINAIGTVDENSKSNILFGNATSEALRKLDEDTLLAVFEGVPQFEISRDVLAEGVKAVDLFVDNAAVFASKGEMRKLVQGGGVSLNKEKLAAFDQVVTTADLLDEKYLLVQRGKKNYYLLIAK